MTTTRRNALRAALAGTVAAIGTSAAAAGNPAPVDADTLRRFIASLRNPPGDALVSTVIDLEDVAAALERLCGFKTPADFRPCYPEIRARREAENGRGEPWPAV